MEILVANGFGAEYHTGMDGAAVLYQLDKERQTVPDSDVLLQSVPYVMRAIAIDGSWNGIVYSCFSSSQAEEIVNEEIKYFTQLNRAFEWKVYSHQLSGPANQARPVDCFSRWLTIHSSVI